MAIFIIFFGYIMLPLFACQCQFNFIHHVWERGAFVGENAKGAHGAVYKFHTSVISAHFFDQE